jgi:hypothetical protein
MGFFSGIVDKAQSIYSLVDNLRRPRLTIVSGDKQAVPLRSVDFPGGFANFAALQVKLADGAGRPIVATPVIFSANGPPAMAIQFTTDGSPPTPVPTDSHGIATLLQMQWFSPELQQYQNNSVQCYYATGPFTVTANAVGLSVTFSLQVLPLAPSPTFPGRQISILSGNDQQARVNSEGLARFTSLKVAVKDQSGRPAAGTYVNFSVGTHPGVMQVYLDPTGLWPVTVVADQNGVSELHNLMYGDAVNTLEAIGTFEIIASVPGSGSVTFSLTATQ